MKIGFMEIQSKKSRELQRFIDSGVVVEKYKKENPVLAMLVFFIGIVAIPTMMHFALK